MRHRAAQQHHHRRGTAPDILIYNGVSVGADCTVTLDQEAMDGQPIVGSFSGTVADYLGGGATIEVSGTFNAPDNG
jgi:hypothetical protein